MVWERMSFRRIARWLADLCVWSLVLGAALFVATWWGENRTAVIERLAAWSSPAPDASRRPVPATLGPRKRAYFEMIRKAAVERSRNSVESR
jgi:hypothetical protein